MANMEFCYENILNTTTMVFVNNGTSTIYNLFDREANYFQSSGDNSDTTITTIEITFSSTETVDRIVLQNINLKSFKIYYDLNPANVITILNSDTNTSSWANNSSTNLYLSFATLSMQNLSIVASATMVANQEKRIGELWITQKILQLDHNPAAKDYDPKFFRKEYIHKMSDGGESVSVIADRFQANIKLNYLSNTARSLLKSVHEMYEPFIFVPFPTGTGWDNRIYAVNWVGDFEFEELKENDINAGYAGKMKLHEIPR